MDIGYTQTNYTRVQSLQSSFINVNFATFRKFQVVIKISIP